MDDICFSGAQLVFLSGIWVVIQAVIVFLFRGWLGSMREQIVACEASIAEARAERDRMADGWERTVGLGERVGEKVIRQQRRRAP